jgi:glycosyltransferase involved in cell wall biosynthesis
METQIVTYVYPRATEYLPQLVSSIRNQTHQNFGVIVFNDGVDQPEQYFNDLNVPIQIRAVSGSPLEIRIASLETLRNNSASYFIFQDADDYMSSNRVEVAYQKLLSYDLVVNDLNLIDERGILIQECIWKQRLQNNFIFTAEFLKDKNIAGLGNTALKRDILHIQIKKIMEPLAADWFIFYQMMDNGKLTGVFTSECQTDYRQHEGNTAGIKKLSRLSIEHAIKVKLAHYKALEALGYNFNVEIKKLEELKIRISYISNFDLNINAVPLWWEETNFYEKN